MNPAKKSIIHACKSASTFHPFATKTMALSLALLLGACASTGDKASAPAPEVKPAKQETTAKAAEAPAPTAAELMKSLRAPAKEPVQVAKSEQELQKELAQKEAQKLEAARLAAEAEAKAKTAVKTDAVVATHLEQKVAAVPAQPMKKLESAVQPVEQKVSAAAGSVAAINAKPFSVSVKQLPFTYDIWTIRKGNTSLTQGLVISTPTWEMGKEGYMSQIWLTLMEDKIHVNSSSDIEPASKGLGISIDGGDVIPFSSIAETNIGVIEGKWLDKLARAGKVDIYLGFFPGKKPMSDTFKSDLSLNNLDRVVATYRLLNQ